MNTLLKKILFVLSVIAFFAMTSVASAQSGASLWKLGSNRLQPVSSSFGLQIPSLNNSGTDCLQVDSSGIISSTGSACSSGASMGGAITGGTQGSVLFVNPANTLAQDNANFFWDDTNNRLGIGTASPSGQLHIDAGATTGRVIFDRDAGNPLILSFRTDNLPRWAFRVDGTESGTNAGSDLAIRRYNDAGTYIDTPLFMYRNTGFVGLGTVTPSTKLEVKDGVIYINQTSGDGYLKASNGSGQGYRITTNGASAGGSLQNYDGSSTALSWISGFLSNSTNGIASTPAFTFAGTPFAGTGTTSTPLLLMQETATTAGTTWNTAGTYLGINARSGYTGNLIDAKINNTSLLTTNSQGATTFGSYVSGASQGSFTVSHGNFRTYLQTTANNINQIVGSTYHVHSTTGIYIGSSEVQPVSRLHVGSAPTASANVGLISLGSGAFDGSTSGFFTGSANGTLIAGNTATGSTADLINLQVGGASKLQMDYIGNTTFAGSKMIVSITNNRVEFYAATLLGQNSITTLGGQDWTVNGGKFSVGGSFAGSSKFSVPVAPTASANYGLVSFGNGAWDGATAGFFTGNASGTTLAVNNVSGYAGDLMNLQLAGVNRFRVESNGITRTSSYYVGQGLRDEVSYKFNLSGGGYTNDLRGANTFAINWTNGSDYLYSVDIGLARNSAGVLRVTDGSTGYGNLTTGSFTTFAGITSSFPALKRNGTGLDVRLADDSGYGGLRAGFLSGTTVYLNGFTSAIKSPSTGVILLQDSAETDFGRLQFGSTTSSFPSIKKSGATLQARLADDSAFAVFTATHNSGGATPAVSNTSANSCGTTSATIDGNDNNGIITVGATAGTSCTVTFVQTAPNRRECMVNNETTANLVRSTYISTTQSKFEGTFVAGDVLAYMCTAR